MYREPDLGLWRASCLTPWRRLRGLCIMASPAGVLLMVTGIGLAIILGRILQDDLGASVIVHIYVEPFPSVESVLL